MATVISHMSMSLDGFVAGPDQSQEQPLGLGGLEVHRWHIGEPLHPVDRRWQEQLLERGDAYIMGRNMFGPVRGPWHGDWRGWWGDEPPYHAPVFVLTHHEREPVELVGTTFHFVTDGFDSALRQARDAVGDGVVDVAGGASAVRQALEAGVLDELVVDVSPVLLGSGESMFAGLGGLDLEPVEVQTSPVATHIRYRRRSATTGR